MTDFQLEKAVVRRLHDALEGASEHDVAATLARHVAPDWRWRGVHPCDEQIGSEAVAEAMWSALLRALTRLQRRPDIFMAGLNHADDGKTRWVVQMGHLLGLFGCRG